MRILHTGDWHLGKVLRGRSRHEEQVAVLADIVGVVEQERIELVVVAGDVFESAAPPADAQHLAWSTLLAFRAAGAEVVVVAGNHDHGGTFEAVRPVFAAAGITLVGRVRRPDEGGVVRVVSPGGEVARIGLLPWLSPRQVVRSEVLFERDAAELGQSYSERLQRVIAALTTPGPERAVELVVAHAFARGGVLGGGERDAQTINDYGISAAAFPPHLSYVALGHLHRRQRIAGPSPTWYSGAPLAIDFGEESDEKGVLLVEASPGTPASVEFRPIGAARRLRTVTGTMAELRERAEALQGDLLRVVVTEAGRAGLAGEVRALLPGALEVRVQHAPSTGDAAAEERIGRSPTASFAAYLQEQGIADDRVLQLFGTLLAEETALDDAEVAG